ncbi:MAG TPA: hypothetical protein PKI44_06370 [Candidatus Omnitrophota bacterium]|nr:hypothetical protein [Candidatus Omnitrophota bacterium]
MFKKILALYLACFITLNFSGCVSVPQPADKIQKEAKLKWNVSYLRGLVIVQGALGTEPIQFEKAIITKEAAKLKGIYADGRVVQIVISKISNSESVLVVRAGSDPASSGEARKILEHIGQYSQHLKR